MICPVPNERQCDGRTARYAYSSSSQVRLSLCDLVVGEKDSRRIAIGCSFLWQDDDDNSGRWGQGSVDGVLPDVALSYNSCKK